MNTINDYVRNNMIPQIAIGKSTGNEEGYSPSMDFKQLLIQKMQTAMAMNSQLQQGDDTPFSSSFLSNIMSHMQSPNQSSNFPYNLGNNLGQALSQYETATNWGQSNINPVTTSGMEQQTTLTKQQPTNKFNDLIAQAAHKYNVDANLIHAIIKMESNYNPQVQSHAGAVGLMQLMPSTAKAVGVTDRFDIAQNIDGGVHYFSKMLQNQKGNIELALASYNAGPGNVKKYGGVPPFKETQNYIKKVMDYYRAS